MLDCFLSHAVTVCFVQPVSFIHDSLKINLEKSLCEFVLIIGVTDKDIDLHQLNHTFYKNIIN